MLLAALIAFTLILCFYCLFYHSKGVLHIAAKCCATAACVGFAAIGLLTRGVFPAASLLFWVLTACMIGDGLLEVTFIPGMGAFALGHVLLIVWMYRLSGGITWISVVIWALAYLAAFLAFRKDLHVFGNIKGFFLMYPAFLMAMAAIALPLPSRIGFQSVPVAIGALLFTCSDMMIAKGLVKKLSLRMDQIALMAYYLAVFLFAFSAWIV